MKEIVVLGGGFAGISALLKLKSLKLKDVNITLIERNSYHLFTPSLYEVATNEEPKKNIAIPYSHIFGDFVKIVKGKVLNIDKKNRLVNLLDKTNYSYDFLIIALGSQPSYFGIEGLESYSIPLKTLEDGVKIRETIENKYHEKVHNGGKVNIVVGGGGFSGTELTAELINYRKRLSIHHNLPQNSIEISIIQGSAGLLKELDEKVSVLAQKRLEDGKVNVILRTHVKKVNEKYIETDTGKEYPYDILIWTGGVRANSILKESGFKTNDAGKVSVNAYMQVINCENIFAVGDLAQFANPNNNKPAPGVAEVAEDEGKIAAENTYRLMDKKELISYHYFHAGYIVPLKGRFAVCDFKNLRITGFLGWILQQLVFLYYLLRILPISKAFKKWDKFEMYLMRS